MNMSMSKFEQLQALFSAAQSLLLEIVCEQQEVSQKLKAQHQSTTTPTPKGPQP